MPKISEVKVSYERSVQPKQFESAKAGVTLTLLFDESEAPDADDVISEQLDRVINHVEGRIVKTGAPKAKPSPTKAASAPQATKAAPAPASTPATGKKASAPGPTAPKPASPSKPGKPAAPTSAKGSAKPKPPVPGKPGKPTAPAKPTSAKTAEPEQGAIVFTKGDAMAAIGATMTRLAAAGKTDGADLIDKIILGYLPDDKPPFSYNRIPEDSLGDFISDLKKLEA